MPGAPLDLWLHKLFKIRLQITLGINVKNRISVALVGVLSLSLAVVACNKKAEPKNTTDIFQPTASIQELMQSVVDPNVDAIWNSVATTSTAAGVEEKRPQTDEEWLALRYNAIALREVSNLLVIEGRKAAVGNAATAADPSELGPEQIDKLIASNRPAFITNAHALHDAVTIALKAINEKDVTALESAGEIIEHSCEQCHSQFWYPGDKRPVH